MQPITRLLPLLPVVVGLAVPAALATPLGASAGPLGTAIPANCVEHTPYDNSADVPGDYRCAGLALAFHTAGSDHSPFPLWAGQWLFTDEAGQYRVGSCTDNRGIHPTVAEPSYPVPQNLPNDATGELSAYIAWRYGDTTDTLTAAAVWALMHYYAQDAAGSNRAQNANAPLIPALDGLAAASGRADLQQRAQELAAEAQRLAGPWTLAVTVDPQGVAVISLFAGKNPVSGQPISLLVSGSDLPLAATTGNDGTATVTVPLPPSGTVTVAAATEAPGSAVVYRGTAAVLGQRAQTLITGGAPLHLNVTGQAEVPPTTEPATTEPATTEPATTEPATTEPATTEPATTEPATTEPATTPPPATTEPATTPPPTTTQPAATTQPPTTTTLGAAPPTTGPGTTTAPAPTTSGVVSMPVTGAGGDGLVAYLATASLVGGIGLMGTLRRRGAAHVGSRG